MLATVRKNFGLAKGQEMDGLDHVVACLARAESRGDALMLRNDGWNIHSIRIAAPNAWNRDFDLLVAFSDATLTEIEDVRPVWSPEDDFRSLAAMEEAARRRRRIS
jgi:hypothetical protein